MKGLAWCSDLLLWTPSRFLRVITTSHMHIQDEEDLQEKGLSSAETVKII